MWEWHAFDLRTGTRLAEVPMASWSHTETLNDSGEWSGELAPDESADRVRELVAATVPTRSVVVGIRDGIVEGDGIVWRRRLPELAGAGLLSYHDRHHMVDSYLYVAMDQHTLMSALNSIAQLGVGGDIQVTHAVSTSGVTRDRSWSEWEAKNVGEAMRQLSAVDGGPDFAVRSELADGIVVRRLRAWTPFRGRRFEASQVVFTLGGNAWTVEPDENGIETTTRAIALGEEIDEVTRERTVATATADDLIAAGWPLLDAVLDRPDVDSSLQEHADGYIAIFGRPQQEQMTMRVDPETAGLWEVGDECMVVIPPWSTFVARTWAPTYLTDEDGNIITDEGGSPIVLTDEVPEDRDETNRPHPWFPDGYEVRRRIVARRWEVDGDGEALFAVTGPTVDD